MKRNLEGVWCSLSVFLLFSAVAVFCDDRTPVPAVNPPAGLTGEKRGHPFRLPAASDRFGRFGACKDEQLRQMAERQKLEMRRRISGMLHDMRMRSLDADIASTSRLFAQENRWRSIMNRQHDYDMAKASGMTLNQWDAFKRTRDAVSLDKNGLYKGADGETYQIDSSGFKWWLYKGDRIPLR